MSQENTQRVAEFNFNFRTKDGIKRPTVTVEGILPTTEGLIAILQGEDDKQKQLIHDLVASAVQGHIRTFVEADENFGQDQYNELFANGKVDVAALANLPKSERNTLSKEQLEEFAKDYIQYMPEITGKDVKRITSAAGLFVERYKRVAGDNAVLAVLQEQLGVFVENAPEEVTSKHERAIGYLAEKVEELLSVKITADAL